MPRPFCYLFGFNDNRLRFGFFCFWQSDHQNAVLGIDFRTISDPDCVLFRERFSDLSEEEIKSLAIYAGMTGGVMMTSDHLGELSPDRLKLWRLILSEERASCDFPLLGLSDIFYEHLLDNTQTNQLRHVPRAEDVVLVQVLHPTYTGALGAIFFLYPNGHTVQRSYALADLGIKDSVYLYSWENESSSEQVMSMISVTLSSHHSGLYFFSSDPIKDTPFRLPS